MPSLDFYKLKLKLLVQANLTAVRLKAEGWKFQVSKGGRGYCFYGKRLITIPRFALDSKLGAGFDKYYLAHEMAHAIAGWQANHGPEFMEVLKRICPAEYLHYEVPYKVRNASSAGISSNPEDNVVNFGEIELVSLEDVIEPTRDYCEDLFDL